MPRPLTALIEREEIDDVAALLQRHRLLTITGPGGVGKTRTAIEASTRRAAAGVPVAFVDLSSLRDGDALGGKIASALGFGSSAGAPSTTSLVAALASAHLLLVLDNCEQIVEEVAELVTALLQGCPSVTVLTTSRELLHCSHEVVYRLPSLQVPVTNPATLHEALSYSAVALFVHRAKQADPQLSFSAQDIPTVIEICRRLDGIPLAIELAAARMASAGFEDVLARLRRSFMLSGGRDLPPRQRTMMATILWSYELLSDAEKRVFERLSVFVGAFTLEAAECVCSDETIAADSTAAHVLTLVDKSLVNIVRVGDRTQYKQLELIRAFAFDRLREGTDFHSTHQRHARWLCDQAVAFDDGTALRARRDNWELDNLKSTVEWCLRSNDQRDVALAANIVASYRRLWMARLGELRDLAVAILGKLDDRPENDQLVANLWKVRFNTESTSETLLAEALPVLQRAGHFDVIAAEQARLASNLTYSESYARAYELVACAALYFEDRPDRRHGLAYTIYASCGAWVFCATGKIERARDMMTALRRSLPMHDLDPGRKINLMNLDAEIAFLAGDTPLALQISNEALTVSSAAPPQSLDGKMTRLNLTKYLVVSGDFDRAARIGTALLASTLTDHETLHHPGVVRFNLIAHLAAVAAHRGEVHLAAMLSGVVDAAYRRQGASGVPAATRQTYDILMGLVSERLSADTLEKLRRDGEALTFQDAADILLAVMS